MTTSLKKLVGPTSIRLTFTLGNNKQLTDKRMEWFIMYQHVKMVTIC